MIWECLIVGLLLRLFHCWDILIHIQFLANVTMATIACNLLQGEDDICATRAVVYHRAKRPKGIAGRLVSLK
jgi:hypothetical protein